MESLGLLNLLGVDGIKTYTCSYTRSHPTTNEVTSGTFTGSFDGAELTAFSSQGQGASVILNERLTGETGGGIGQSFCGGNWEQPVLGFYYEVGLSDVSTTGTGLYEIASFVFIALSTILILRLAYLASNTAYKLVRRVDEDENEDDDLKYYYTDSRGRERYGFRNRYSS